MIIPYELIYVDRIDLCRQIHKSQQDNKTANMPETTIYGETDTLGFLYQEYALQDNTTYFAGYKRVHPLKKEIRVCIETMESRPLSECIQSTNQRIRDEIQRIKHTLE